MVLILPEHSQRPYRYGMTLLCVGAMFNWLGLADNNAEPVRYIGVTLIGAGALLICLAMCFWMKATHDPQVAMVQAEGDNVHHIVTIHNNDSILEKPPDYEAVTGSLPPSYEDAIKLNPMHLLLADSNQVGVSKSEPSISSQSEGQSTSIPCQVHRSVDDTDSKPEDENKIITTPSISATTMTTMTSNSENSSQSTDNFGSRVLRLSRKFLGRTKSSQHDAEAVERTTREISVSSEVNNLDTSVR